MPDIISCLVLHMPSVFFFPSGKFLGILLGSHVLKSQEDEAPSEIPLSGVWTCSGALQSESSYLCPGGGGEMFRDL